MNYPNYGFNLDQQGGYSGSPSYSSGLPYPLAPGGPQPMFPANPAGSQSGYSAYGTSPQSGYSAYGTSPQSGYSPYPAEQSYSNTTGYSLNPPTAPYEDGYSAGQYATAPALGYDLGPSGMSYAGATPAGYQRVGSPSAGYQRSRSPSPGYRSVSPSAGYQSAGYQPSGYQSATSSSDYPSLYPVSPVSGQAFSYPGSSQYSARSYSPSRDGLAGPVPYPGAGQYSSNSTETEIPTVVPANPFDARQDAGRLHTAFRGFGSDKETIINILCRRTSTQRMQIVACYKSAFGKDLTKRLIKELHGDMEKVMVALTTPMFEYLAGELYHSLAGLGTRERILIEILCPATNFEIQNIKSAYQACYGRSLESDIKGDTSGNFERVLIALIQGMRDEGNQTSVEQATNDARRLYEAGAKRMGTEESVFINILATRSWAQIRLIMTEYTRVANKPLEKAIASEFSGYVEKALLTILQCASNRHAYFATCLRACTSGLGTRDRDLVRMIVSHCDTDLGSIKQQYRLLYKTELAKDVAGDTSGNYKKAMLTLIGP